VVRISSWRLGTRDCAARVPQIGAKKAICAFDTNDVHDVLERSPEVFSTLGVFLFDKDEAALKLCHYP